MTVREFQKKIDSLVRRGQTTLDDEIIVFISVVGDYENIESIAIGANDSVIIFA